MSIEIESAVFTAVASVVRAEFQGISCYGEYVEAPASFPCITLIEADSSVYQRTSDSSRIENHDQLMYELNVYANDVSGKKLKAKSIANLVDKTMEDMGFVRTMRSQTPNVERGTYRITARYTAVVDAGVTVSSGNTTYTKYTTFNR